MDTSLENTTAEWAARHFSYDFNGDKTIGEIKEAVNELSEFIGENLNYFGFYPSDSREFLKSGIFYFNDYEVLLQTFHDWHNMESDRLPTYQEFINSEKVIVAGSLSADFAILDDEGNVIYDESGRFTMEGVYKEKINEHIKIYDEEFRITGYYSGPGYLSFFDSLPEQTRVRELTIDLINIVSSERVKEIDALVTSLFDINPERIYLPHTKDLLQQQYSAINIFVSILIIFAVIMNTALIYKFMITLRIKSLVIYRMCGMTKGSCVRYCLIESTILSSLSFLISALISMFFTIPAATENYGSFNYIFTFNLFFLVFAVYLTASLIINLLYVSPAVLKSINSMYKEGI
jgi:ABC-type antimicrobial peptide transport system permease subunit